MSTKTSAVPDRVVVRRTINDLLANARVYVVGHSYGVDFGPGVRPRYHRVGKNKRCSCYLGSQCPAVSAVAQYLREGGKRAPEPPRGYFLAAPETCPVCGAPTRYDPSLNNPHWGAGWRCENGGSRHFWDYRSKLIQDVQGDNPWVFRPIVDETGKVVYPGVRRDDVAPASMRPNWPEGYDPNR